MAVAPFDPVPVLLDEHSRPDFRDLFGRYARESESLSAAVRRVRLAGMDLGATEIGGLGGLRLLVGEVNALELSSEAEALAGDPDRRARLSTLVRLLDRRRLQVRIAPLAGWTPDFTVFERPDPRPPVMMLGTHWFERPFPHPGPAFGVVVEGDAARLAFRRFDATWARAHELAGPIRTILHEAIERTAVRPERELTLSDRAGYSSRAERLGRWQPSARFDPA